MIIRFFGLPQSLVKTKIAVYHRLKDVLASVHFREEALQTLVMVETWTREEAQRAIAALAVGVTPLPHDRDGRQPGRRSVAATL